ncbi:MAG: AI-2E family transporter [Pseudomonadota bacterium]
MADEQAVRRQLMRNSVDVFISVSIVALVGYMAVGVIAPFFSVVIWAVIMAVGVYPAYLWLRSYMGKFGGWAAPLIALIGLVVLITPTVLIVESILQSLGPIAQSLAAGEAQIPPARESVKDWPLIGNRVFEMWTAASENFGAFAASYATEIRSAAGKVLSISAGLLGGVLQFALAIIFATVFMSYADPLVRLTDQLVARIASDRGSAMLLMAAQTARNVTKGVIGVAVIQGGLGAIGVLAIGMPFAGVIAALLVASTLVQAPVIVIVPCIIYVWSAEPTLAAILFTAYMVPVLLSDNVLKPVLMARGLETPMVVILIGVIGGTVSGGLIGLFTGPVILAVFYKMVTMWIESVSSDAERDTETGAETGAETDAGSKAGAAPTAASPDQDG